MSPQAAIDSATSAWERVGRPMLAEFLGTAILLIAVVGSGIMATNLSTDTGLQLLENAAATGGALIGLILMFGAVSGAHFNPVVSLVDAAFGDIVKAATQWQPVKEKEAAQESPYPAKTFKFTGTYADVNKLFAKRKWSLSLPIIPPTVDRVREMLKGTKHAPSEVLWVVPPRQGMLTVELVAVLELDAEGV